MGLLLISGLCSFKKDKNEKPEPAFSKGSITAIGAYGLPGALWKEPTATRGVTRGCLIAGGEYQVARWFSAGLLYSYYNSGTGMQQWQDPRNGTIYLQDTWSRDHAFTATADFYYLNRSKICIGSGVGIAIHHTRSSMHFIDSMGVSIYKTFRPYNLLDLGIRLVHAKVRITDNFGVFGGMHVCPGAQYAIGAHYTFAAHK
ncbi:hypothetical protein GCM10023093_09890 [Nemorincola caseinilytica]|uniref:Uncharacterized protein n=2 Tax=Nemorincola caseinilytica TaxID=2054315 RepID=A0ABP8N7N0_9BACT